MTNNLKKGFTLVELSIVLVIIGLLIGGILVAQSMIGTAKVQALTRQFGSFDTAVANFQTKFNSALPGDYAAIGDTPGATTDGDGDGDGIIEDTAGVLLAFSGEIGTFWNALSLTGFSTDGQGTGGTKYVQHQAVGALVNSGTTANVPKPKAGSSRGAVVAWGTAGANYYTLASTANMPAAATPWTATTAGNGALKPADGLALDTKMDDGIANTGSVRASAVLATGIDDATLASCSTGAPWVVATLTEDCNVRVRMGLSTGMNNQLP